MARHNLTASLTPAPHCLLHTTSSCLQNNSSLLSHFRSLGCPSSILESACGDILPYKKNNYLISLIPNYYAQAYLRKGIRFSLFFWWLHQRTGDEFERDTPLLCCSEGGPTHGWTGGGESTVRLSCKTSPLGPPLGARCFLPQVGASVLLLLGHQAARCPLLTLQLERQHLHSQSTEMEKVGCLLLDLN